MTKEEREQFRTEINGRRLTDFVSLTRSRKAGANMFNCPVCGSGTGKKGTGALKIYPNNRVLCNAQNCFGSKGQDTLGALRIIWNCSETEAMNRAGYYSSTEPGRTIPAPMKKETPKEEPKPRKNYSSFYRECHEALKKSQEALAYLNKRGITEESIDRFNLGYCESWKHSTAGKWVNPSKRIIIPRTAETYLARRIDEPKTEAEKDFTKQIQGTQRDLFNLEAIKEEIVIVCEGELDAISLYQAGAAAVVGLGSTGNCERFLEAAKTMNPEGLFFLALDNDEPGKKAQEELEKSMNEAGLSGESIDTGKLFLDCKDANEAFVKNADSLTELINIILSKAQASKEDLDRKREAELRKRTGEGMLEDFLEKVKGTDFEPIKTGIIDLDKALNGGFTRKTLVTLGAAPGMGKTALAQWIFENIAEAGQSVLYINLEMAREQLLARSISRIAWKYQKKDIDALKILRGYSWTEEEAGIIGMAAEVYKERIAPNFIYNPDGVTNEINSIFSAMEAETNRLKAKGEAAPLICIDYLQLIDSGEKDAMQGMKNVIARLKNFAKEKETVIFAIIANNRAANKEGISTQESGRDTSAIEYSGDVMLGISYTAIMDHRKYNFTDENGKEKTAVYDLDEIRRLKREAYEKGMPLPSVCNEISVEIVKNRFGDSERRANFIFDGKHSTFTLIEHRFKEGDFAPYTGKNPFN